MKTPPLVWLHEYALSVPPVETLGRPPESCRFVHIWDDAVLRGKNYSLKRLAFIYQSLLTLPVDILSGDTLDVLKGDTAQQILIPEAVDPFIHDIAARLAADGKTVTWVEAAPFALLKRDRQISRFFQYWKQAERTAFLYNAGRV